MDNLQIAVSAKTKDEVINGLKKVVKSIYDTEPIVGCRESTPARIYLIYQAVENSTEVSIKAMGLGASMAGKF